MTTFDTTDKRHRITTYVVLGVIFLLLAGGALWAYGSAKSTAEAEHKADQYLAELTAYGLRTPTREQVIQVLGDDGGALCADPAGGLRRGVLYGTMTNGAGGPGARPVIVDNRVVQGQLLAIKIYCPEHLARFATVVQQLKYADVGGK